MSSSTKPRPRKMNVVNVVEPEYVNDGTSLIDQFLKAASADDQSFTLIPSADADVESVESTLNIKDMALVPDAPVCADIRKRMVIDAPICADTPAVPVASKRKAPKKATDAPIGEATDAVPVVNKRKPRTKKVVAEPVAEPTEAVVEPTEAVVEPVAEPTEAVVEPTEAVVEPKTRKPRAKKADAEPKVRKPRAKKEDAEPKTRKPRAKKAPAPEPEPAPLSLMFPEIEPFTPSASEVSPKKSDTSIDVEVEEATIDGVLYYKDASGQLYDHDTFAIINK
jgi:hypothetical protein